VVGRAQVLIPPVVVRTRVQIPSVVKGSDYISVVERARVLIPSVVKNTQILIPLVG
jgi:hypothetical protein